jgi:hypothetical protein
MALRAGTRIGGNPTGGIRLLTALTITLSGVSSLALADERSDTRGTSIKGASWGRPDDRVGIAAALIHYPEIIAIIWRRGASEFLSASSRIVRAYKNF